MSSSAKPPRKKPQTYHHGDLKNALLEAARALANEVGVDNFTLREVARRAGVSPAAPYHHFSDKNDLVRGLAIQAFEELSSTLEKARQTQQKALGQLQAIGLAYVRFALAHPNEFRFMFRRELCAPAGQPDPLQEAGLASQTVLFNAIAHGLAQNEIQNHDAKPFALMFWATIHGLCNILLETPFGKNTTPKAAQNMATQAIAQALQAARPTPQ